jgi:uncharacterized membrane protein YtjA (UPF0391 family)
MILCHQFLISLCDTFVCGPLVPAFLAMCQFTSYICMEKTSPLVSFRLFSSIGTSTFLRVTLLAFPLLKPILRNLRFYNRRYEFMLRWSITFLVIGLIAGVLGFTGVAGAASQIAWILFGVFLTLFLVSLLMGRGRSATSSRNDWAAAVAHSNRYIRFRCQP